MKDLQKEKISHKFKPEDNKLFEILKSVSYHGDCDSYDPISAYKWIQENYVSKYKVRGLKMEKEKIHLFGEEYRESNLLISTSNDVINKFINLIDKIIK